MRQYAESHKDVYFIAVSHSDQAATDKWLDSCGGPGKVTMIVDNVKSLYARWGLGVASYGHIFNMESFKQLYKLAVDDKITNRPTESGSRWQTSGSWAINSQGIITWGGLAQGAHEVPDVQSAIASLREAQ